MTNLYRTLLLLTFLLITNNCFAEKSKFQLGVALCLSGGCSEWGQSALNGIRLASKEINQKGGILGQKIQLIIEDTDEATSGRVAVNSFKKLINIDKVQYLIGPSWTPAGLAVIPLLANKNLIAITPSMAVPDFSMAADNMFKTVPNNEVTARHIARFAWKSGIQTAAIISDILPAEKYTSKVFAEEFKKLGGKITLLIETLPEENDLKTPALKIIKNNPEAVFLANYVKLGITAKRLRQFGYQGQFLSILLDKTRLDEGGSALNATYFSNYTSFSEEFYQKYQ